MLCSIAGSTLKRVLAGVEPATELAWNDHERELWLLSTGGEVVVLMPSGRTYSRDMALGSLYSDPCHALAVTAGGTLVDLSCEVPTMKNVSFLSHPFAIDPTMRLKRISWNMFAVPCEGSEGASPSLVLTLRGERGASCHGYLISQVRASGIIAAPLSRPIIAPPTRTLRLQVQATAASGTLLLPTFIVYS